jgi:hypothetical protein
MFDCVGRERPRREHRPARFLSWIAFREERWPDVLEQDLLRYYDRGVRHRDRFRTRPPRHDARFNPGQVMEETGLFENIPNQRERLLTQHDGG